MRVWVEVWDGCRGEEWVVIAMPTWHNLAWEAITDDCIPTILHSYVREVLVQLLIAASSLLDGTILSRPMPNLIHLNSHPHILRTIRSNPTGTGCLNFFAEQVWYDCPAVGYLIAWQVFAQPSHLICSGEWWCYIAAWQVFAQRFDVIVLQYIAGGYPGLERPRHLPAIIVSTTYSHTPAGYSGAMTHWWVLWLWNFMAGTISPRVWIANNPEKALAFIQNQNGTVFNLIP